jgi:signal transduction histidine kinase
MTEPTSTRGPCRRSSATQNRPRTLRAQLTVTIVLLVLAFGLALVVALNAVVNQSVNLATDLGDGLPVRIQINQHQAAGQITRSVAIWSVVIVVAFAAVASILGWWLLRRTLRRLEVATDVARTVRADRLDVRLPVDGPRDEVQVLAETINAMLDRLTGALQAQSRFVANASHELRTPLATARTALDIPLTQGRVPADLEPAVRRAVAANERSARILDALLTLALAQGAQEPSTVVDLGAIADAALHERLEVIGVAGLDLRVDTVPTAVVGDEAMLTQVCTNLIDNAIMHNQPGGTVTLHCATGAGPEHPYVVLEVSNGGPLLDPDTVDTLREPFHRGENSRLQHRPAVPVGTGPVGTGLGLGLAIVEDIVTRHAGRLMLTARPTGGLTARVELPAPAGHGQPAVAP